MRLIKTAVAAFALLSGLADAVPLRQSIAAATGAAASEAVAIDGTSGEFNSAAASEPLPAALKNAEAALQQANAAVEQAAAALDTSGAAATSTETQSEDAAPASSEDAAPASSEDAAPASDNTAPASNETAPASSDDNAPASSDDTAPASDDTAPASNDAAPAGSEDAAPASDTNAADSKDPCKEACTPRIDVKASVMESYKRHRAQAALIGDYGSCKAGGGAGEYTWTVDWGDDESYEHKRDTIGPYQAEHVYAKKGKYTVEATFCHKLDGCDSGCTSYSEKVHVRP